MPTILDTAPVPKVVKTHKYGDLDVTGLSFSGIVHIVKNHPEIFAFFDGAGQEAIANMDIQALMDLGEDVVVQFLAAGLGFPGNPEVIEKCKGMNTPDMWTISRAILEESFPGGAVNFFKTVKEAIAKAKGMQESILKVSSQEESKLKDQKPEEASQKAA